MSHLVSNTYKIESNPIFDVPFRQVISPQYRKLFRGTLTPQQMSSHKSENKKYEKLFKNKQISRYHHTGSANQKNQCWKQEVALMSFCNKLTQKQLDHIRSQNQNQIKLKFSKLKNKLRKSAVSPYDTVLKYFDENRGQQRLDTLLTRNRNCQIQVLKKHNTKITNRLFCLKQAKQIGGLKEKYRYWLDSNNNQPSKSPNFRKMNFIFEKIADKTHNDCQQRKIRKTDNQKQAKYDKFGQEFIRKNQHSEYSPKSKLNDFFKKRLR